jgi:perosamine synthetase
MIPLFWPAIYKQEWLCELGKIFDTRWLGEGPKTKEFETKFGEKFEYDYCLTTNSGTSALELAYHLLDLRENDLVFSTVLTCTATHMALLRRNVDLQFVDIDSNTLNMSVSDLAVKLVDYPRGYREVKAIVVVNLGGVPVDTGIFELAKEYNIPVVVDACQSLGITESNGDFVAYSFQAIKHFTTFDGGMLVCRNESDYLQAKKLRWFGIDRDKKASNNWQCLNSQREVCMDMLDAGYKFHMNDIAATIGLVGLSHSDEILEHRKRIASIYNNTIKHLMIKTISGGSYWLYCLIVPDAYIFGNKLRELGVECDPVQLRNDIFTVFGGYKQDLQNMNDIENKYLYIPIHTNMNTIDAYQVSTFVMNVATELYGMDQYDI